MFGLKKQNAMPEADESVEETQARLNGAKSAPTPRRKDQVAARQRPLIASDRTQAKANDRQRRAEQQDRIRRGMATGEEQFLLPRDRGPQRRFARNFADARTCIAEFFFPIIILFFIVSIGLSPLLGYQGQLATTFSMYGVLLLVAIDMFFTWRALKKRLLTKFDSVERGVLWYGTFRTLQLRFMRQPKPQVKRGTKLE
ncbi:DUF3043 domain-containing protein [Galactobacter caseinivorans]|uniref:DUF3043 domain-containing protein n=2 Tax=Galactobacter caseinivorans TaxID=2676123 RepID=A0A496PKV0_9MICC|nr:DUF3043 domain-containing protein [Galactobacter caseinivorans]